MNWWRRRRLRTADPWAHATAVPVEPAQVVAEENVRASLDRMLREQWAALAAKLNCDCWPRCRQEVDQGGPVIQGRRDPYTLAPLEPVTEGKP